MFFLPNQPPQLKQFPTNSRHTRSKETFRALLHQPRSHYPPALPASAMAYHINSKNFRPPPHAPQLSTSTANLTAPTFVRASSLSPPRDSISTSRSVSDALPPIAVVDPPRPPNADVILPAPVVAVRNLPSNNGNNYCRVVMDYFGSEHGELDAFENEHVYIAAGFQPRLELQVCTKIITNFETNKKSLDATPKEFPTIFLEVDVTFDPYA